PPLFWRRTVVAEQIMRQLNPHGLIARLGLGQIAAMIEDVSDPDGRMYRLEYQSTGDAQHAIAFCRYNPWGGTGSPSAGADYDASHVDEDGFLCLGTSSERVLTRSPYDLTYVI